MSKLMKCIYNLYKIEFYRSVILEQLNKLSKKQGDIIVKTV